MGYSIEPRDKSLSNKYSQKLLNSAKKYKTDAIKTVSQRATQKTAQATGHSIGNKTADKITSFSKNLLKNYIIMMKQKMKMCK